MTVDVKLQIQVLEVIHLREKSPLDALRQDDVRYNGKGEGRGAVGANVSHT